MESLLMSEALLQAFYIYNFRSIPVRTIISPVLSSGSEDQWLGPDRAAARGAWTECEPGSMPPQSLLLPGFSLENGDPSNPSN